MPSPSRPCLVLGGFVASAGASRGEGRTLDLSLRTRGGQRARRVSFPPSFLILFTVRETVWTRRFLRVGDRAPAVPLASLLPVASFSRKPWVLGSRRFRGPSAQRATVRGRFLACSAPSRRPVAGAPGGGRGPPLPCPCPWPTCAFLGRQPFWFKVSLVLGGVARCRPAQLCPEPRQASAAVIPACSFCLAVSGSAFLAGPLAWILPELSVPGAVAAAGSVSAVWTVSAPLPSFALDSSAPELPLCALVPRDPVVSSRTGGVRFC